jgi:hypothetical protein
MMSSVVSVVPDPDGGKLRVTAGPVRLAATHHAAARRHFEVGVFSHRRKDERVLEVGRDTARISYKIGWGPISTTVELIASLDRTASERSSTVWFVCSKGLMPLAGTWRYEAREDGGGCDLYLEQTVDARRIPKFVPLHRLIRSAISKAIDEQKS